MLISLNKKFTAFKFTGEITHLSQKGYGVVKNKHNNISYFVSGTWPGDIGKFEVIDKPLDNKKFVYARLVCLLNPSEHRQYPACIYLQLNENPCTGSAMQTNEVQINQKRSFKQGNTQQNTWVRK